MSDINYAAIAAAHNAASFYAVTAGDVADAHQDLRENGVAAPRGTERHRATAGVRTRRQLPEAAYQALVKANIAKRTSIVIGRVSGGYYEYSLR